MPSLILLLALTLGAAWLASRPVAGAWFSELLAAGPALAPIALVGGWALAWLAQALAAWQAWRTAGRHAAPWLAACILQWTLWVAWPWTLLHWHRPGWSLGVLSLAGACQVWLLFSARGLGLATVIALLPPAAWLSLLWWFNHAWWRVGGGGAASIFG